ncbi:MAG TPA: hypothetical protein VN222_10815 [Novosphingobium sp.]|nr:hypothetical protein [Novosphingobium sp.]
MRRFAPSAAHVRRRPAEPPLPHPSWRATPPEAAHPGAPCAHTLDASTFWARLGL